MKKYIYAAGVAALTLAVSGLPAMAFAENGGLEGQVNAAAQVGVQVQERDSSVRTDGEVRSDVQGNEDQSDVASSSDRGDKNSQIDENQNDDEEISLDLEDDSHPAVSLEDLKQKIEDRKHELEQEVASTSPDHQDIVENANQMRLAVRALLASKDLVGGIGDQVSELAKQMNESVATTTEAEAKVQARGFLVRLFFGGDSAAAEVIAQQVAQNQARIDELTKLLNGANVSADIQVVLKAQIAAIQDAQARLQDLAQKEQKSWGLFSWRF